MSFIAPQFTNKGKQLQARALSGECTITFTTIGLGSGELETQAISALTDLIQTVKKVGISDIRVINPDQVQLKAVFQNVGMSSGFFWREVGLFAADPDNPDDRTKDILYCYQNAGDLAEYIPSASSQLVDKIINMAVVVADATQVNISFYSETYALKEDFDEHKTDENAHGNLFAKSVNGINVSDNNNIELSLVRNSFADDSQKSSSVFGGEAYGKGAGLFAYGAKHANYPGFFDLYAMTSEGEKAELVGTPAGSLTWRRKNLVRSVNGVYADAKGNVKGFFPSSTFINITVSDGTEFIAPTNGWIYITGIKNASGVFGKVRLYIYKGSDVLRVIDNESSSGTNSYSLITPLSKGEVVRFNIFGSNEVQCRFSYAQGEEP